MSLLDRVRADLALVGAYWPALAELKDPQAAAPRPPSTITATARAELDYLARIERWERDGLAPGEHVDAVRVEILDLMAQTTAQAADAVEELALANGLDTPLPPTTAFDDPARQIGFLLDHLADADPTTLRRVGAIAAKMAAEITRALYLAPDGQTIKAACPWCHGGLSGSLSLRVRLLPGGLVAVVCESDIPCDPPRRKVGTWIHGRPAWPFEDWRWLGGILHKATHPTPTREPIGSTLDGSVGRSGTPTADDYDERILSGLVWMPNEDDRERLSA